MEDKKIVDLFWQRDENAITVAAAKYGRYCNTIANNILHNAYDAEECVNDTYIGAWNSMPDNKPENLGHYLGRMTRWLSLNRLDERRSRKRGGNLPEALPLDELADCASCEAGTEELVEYKELCAAINRFLSGLHPVERQLFLARYWFLAPLSDIADKFGFTQSKVKSQLYRIRNRLRRYLEEEGLC